MMTIDDVLFYTEWCKKKIPIMPWEFSNDLKLHILHIENLTSNKRDFKKWDNSNVVLEYEI